MPDEPAQALSDQGDRRMLLEDNPYFQSWFAFNCLGFLLAIVVLCICDGEGSWGRPLFIACLVPTGITIASVALGFAGLLLFLVADPFLPTPRGERIPRDDLRQVGR